MTTVLDTYYQEFGYYPCPASRALLPDDKNYGMAIDSCHLNSCPTGTQCAQDVVIGTIPFKTLGIKINKDSWDNKFLYAVDKKLTNIESGYCTLQGSITVESDGGHRVTNQAAYIVLSHGNGQNGAYKFNRATPYLCDSSRLDHENCSNSTVFRQYNLLRPNFSAIAGWRELNNYSNHTITNLQYGIKPHQISGHIYTYFTGNNNFSFISPVEIGSLFLLLRSGNNRSLKASNDLNSDQFIIETIDNRLIISRFNSQNNITTLFKRSEFLDNMSDNQIYYTYDPYTADGKLYYNKAEIISWDDNLGDLRHLRDFAIINKQILQNSDVQALALFDRALSPFECQQVMDYLSHCAV